MLKAFGPQRHIANLGHGLYPDIEKDKVKYFVDLGRSAYATLSGKATDLYGLLAMQFVVLMDVLQSVNQRNVLMPIEAYELWNELGSQRALNSLREYRLHNNK